MNSAAEARARRRFWALFILAAVLAVVCIVMQKPAHTPEGSKPKERSRNELEMKDGHLCYTGKPFSGLVFDQYDGGEINSAECRGNY